MAVEMDCEKSIVVPSYSMTKWGHLVEAEDRFLKALRDYRANPTDRGLVKLFLIVRRSGRHLYCGTRPDISAHEIVEVVDSAEKLPDEVRYNWHHSKVGFSTSTTTPTPPKTEGYYRLEYHLRRREDQSRYIPENWYTFKEMTEPHGFVFTIGRNRREANEEFGAI